MSDARQYAPATRRNREPILTVLHRVLPARGLVLEVASGTGEHVARFASAFPHLIFQPSDPDPAARESIAAWTRGIANVRPPLALMRPQATGRSQQPTRWSASTWCMSRPGRRPRA